MESLTEQNTAKLSSIHDYTIFRFDKYRFKFRAPYSLVRYIKVTKWKNGFITVMTEYNNRKEEIEEYIDIGYILEIFNFNVNNFLSLIKNVRVDYD